MTRHFTKDDDLTPAEQAEVLALAAELKATRHTAAAALAVLDTIRDEGLLERAKELEHRFTAGIEGLGHPAVSGVRGKGALLGVVLTAPVGAALETHLREAGFLANAVAPGVLRLAPSLVLTDAQVDAFVAALPAALDTSLEETTS